MTGTTLCWVGGIEPRSRIEENLITRRKMTNRSYVTQKKLDPFGALVYRRTDSGAMLCASLLDAEAVTVVVEICGESHE